MRDMMLKEIKGVENHEVFTVESEINEAHLEKNKINFSSKTFDSGYGIRVLDGGLGFSSSNVKSTEIIRKVVENARKSARMTEKVNFQFPTQRDFHRVEIVDKNIEDNAEDAIADFVERMLSEKPNDVNFSFGKFRTYDSKVSVFNSEGLDLERKETMFMVELSITVEGAKKMEFWPHDFRRRIDGFGQEDFKKWFQLSRDQLRAELPDTGKMTVIFSPNSVADGLGTVIDFQASGVAKVNEMSKFSLGEKVGSDGLTVYSDGLYPFGLMSSGFDDEGVPQQKLTLIKDGVFKNFAYDQFYALKDGAQSTGNGLRQSTTFYVFDAKFASSPSNQVSNFYVKPGNKSLDALVAEVKDGIIVDKFSWLNPDGVTGDFSSEISAGYRIKEGGIASPIKGGLVAGNIIDMIKNISGISDQSVIASGGTFLSGICPHVRFEDVQVAGK
jgi:PmbA protein